jgi:hypothetical protein
MFKVTLPFDKVELEDKVAIYTYVKRRALSQHFREPEIILWLNENFSSRCDGWLTFRCLWFYTWYVSIDIETCSYHFYFKNKADALLFKLTWG